VPPSRAYFQDIVAAIFESRDVSERWSRVTAMLADIGMDQINYGLFDPSVADRLEAPVSFLSTMRPDWLEFYSDRRLDLDDPHVILVRQGNLRPYHWDASGRAGITEDRVRAFDQLAVEAGLTSQLQVILPDEGSAVTPVGGMALGSSLPEKEYARIIAGHAGSLITIAHLFHGQSIGQRRRDIAGVKPLSVRERDCLSLVASGLRIDRIADRLGLARATVEMHLKRTRTKLRAATLPEAVAKALTYHEIRLEG